MSLCFRYNSITALRENDLLGLEKLELLMLHSNMIMDIEDNTFQDLKSLQVKTIFFHLAFGQNFSTSWTLDFVRDCYEDLLHTVGCILEIPSHIVERPSLQGLHGVL